MHSYAALARRLTSALLRAPAMPLLGSRKAQQKIRKQVPPDQVGGAWGSCSAQPTRHTLAIAWFPPNAQASNWQQRKRWQTLCLASWAFPSQDAEHCVRRTATCESAGQQEKQKHETSARSPCYVAHHWLSSRAVVLDFSGRNHSLEAPKNMKTCVATWAG